MKKRAADIFFGVLMLCLILLVFSSFFGLADWLEGKGIPKLIGFWGPILVGLIGGAVLKHFRSEWME